MPFSFDRRSFLASAASASLLVATQRTGNGEETQIINPRATDGDQRFEPAWDEKLTVTVGVDRGDLVGNSDRVLQAAVDYLHRFGGGTVRVLPGTYSLRNSVHLPSAVRILGSGPESIITKAASVRVKLAQDSDWYDQEITLDQANGLRVGDGVVLQAKNPHDGSQTVIKRTLIARSGNRFKLNAGLRKNLWLSGQPTCASLFPLLTSEHSSDVVIENITLDGNQTNNENLNGNYGGNIFIQDCNRFTFRNVESRNYNGDGISFQICHDVIVENCYSHDNAGLGVHPGSGSQRPRLRGNKLARNNIGLFWCWGVKYGLAEDNQITDNRSYGISIGHNDTDNVMRNNLIQGSGRVGILFRDDARGADFWANRNVLEGNTILNSGDANGIAIDVQGNTKDLTLRNNQVRETRGPMQRVGLRISQKSQRIQLAGNTFSGLATQVLDLRSADHHSSETGS